MIPLILFLMLLSLSSRVSKLENELYNRSKL
jgi:hypothetical protein